jgi:hypothetical protein
MSNFNKKFMYFQEPTAEFSATASETEGKHFEDGQDGDLNEEVSTENIILTLHHSYLVVIWA